ncbi:MAG: GIY-YIG nuclease family protein [Crocinitomicaceae bacterium]|nr:GIY-YIG nuclease family protein [Crocinitomicaceae bacterium]
MEEKIFSVYVIRSINTAKIYVGMATDIQKRLNEHNAGKSKYTSSFIPWELIYIEQIGNSQECRKREKYFKSAAGKKFLHKKEIL